MCGIARVPLHDLSRGATCVRFAAPIAPHTTIRGAASLDWATRPGNYSASQAVLKGWVRCAVPFAAMSGVPLAERVFSRAVFVMDYRDSDLFHLLEDTVRRQNAWALGLAEPAPPSQPLTPTATEGGAPSSREWLGTSICYHGYLLKYNSLFGVAVLRLCALPSTCQAS